MFVLSSSPNSKGANWNLCEFTWSSHHQTGLSTIYGIYRCIWGRATDKIPLGLSRVPLKIRRSLIHLTSSSRRLRGISRIWKRIRISRVSLNNSEKSQVIPSKTGRSMRPWLGTIGPRMCQATSTTRTSGEPIYTITSFEKVSKYWECAGVFWTICVTVVKNNRNLTKWPLIFLNFFTFLSKIYTIFKNYFI